MTDLDLYGEITDKEIAIQKPLLKLIWKIANTIDLSYIKGCNDNCDGSRDDASNEGSRGWR